MRKCHPGVICIENITILILFISLIIFLIVFFRTQSSPINNSEKIIIKEKNDYIPSSNNYSSGFGFGFFPRYNYGYTNLPNDILLNPYTPPLKDERYIVPSVEYIPPGTIPINISTNIGAVDTNYRQLGILTPLNGPNKDNILPLMGRPLFTSRQKFQYYTTSNQQNNIKLPLSVKGRSGTNEYGVDELFTGDTVYIEGANEVYKVTVYYNATIKYIPAI